MIKSEVRRILDIVADLSQNDVKKDVIETVIDWTDSHAHLSNVLVKDGISFV